jgi:alkanesulfonate monooxygenase SsuD/methylene tetrahydromethanopterin reductase-like flavin-dependent oxidoreductase (luciferase family)
MPGGDRFGVRWGLAGGVALASIEEARDVARYADAAGFDSLWISHANAVDPIVALA